MPPKPSDPQQKAIEAGNQLQQALVSVSEALKTIATVLPSLFPENDGSTKISNAAPTSSTLAANSASTETAAAAANPNKRKRREKDPNAPEKPPSAYHLFIKEAREEVRQALGGNPSANDIVAEINRRWKDMNDVLKKPFVDAAEKAKGPYKLALEQYERLKAGISDGAQSAPKVPEPSKSKPASAKGGFTAVKAAPLVVNPVNEGDSDEEAEDEAAVAANLGGAQPSTVPATIKRQKKGVAKQTETDGGKKDKKDKSKDKSKDKDKPKEKEKEKEKKKRRKSKGEA